MRWGGLTLTPKNYNDNGLYDQYFVNKELTNLGPKGEKHFLNKTQVSNCLLEVPQDIHYEITDDGRIILKAGSRVYVSTNGTFEAVTLTSDSDVGAGGLWTNDNGRKVFVVYIPETNDLICQPVDFTFSQVSAPTSFVGNSALWYDTTNRVMKCTWNSGADWSICSLPILMGRPGMISSGKNGWAGVIDNIFNGMGFFGSTAWVGKGVKGLIPEGRNEDGTLKNIEFTTNKVLLGSRTGTFDGVVAITPSGLSDGNCYPVNLVTYTYSETAPNTVRWYKPSENKFYQFVGGVWYEDKQMHAAYFSISNSKITSFRPLQSLQAADAQNFVNKYNNEDVYGTKTFVNPTTSNICMRSETYDVTNKQASQYYGVFEIRDKNNFFVGRFDTMNTSDITIRTRIGVQNSKKQWSILEAVADESGNLYAKCHPSAVAGSILTTTQISKAANGYVKLGNGLILQWGKQNSAANAGVGTVTLPTPFTSTNYRVMVTVTDMNDWWNEWGFGTQSKTTTNFKIYFKTADKPVEWFAIGY